MKKYAGSNYSGERVSNPNIDALSLDSLARNVNIALDFYLFWEYIPNSNLNCCLLEVAVLLISQPV
jgi:hypothetical protein